MTVSVPPRRDEFDYDAVRLRLHLRRRDPALDAPPSDARWASRIRWVSYCGRLHWNLQWQSMPSWLMARARTCQGRTDGSTGRARRLEERRKQTDGFQDLEGAGLDRRGTRLAVRPDLPLDEPRAHAVAGELAAANSPEGPAPMTKTLFCVISFEFYRNRPRF